MPCMWGSVMPVPSSRVAQSTVVGEEGQNQHTCASMLMWNNTLMKGNCADALLPVPVGVSAGVGSQGEGSQAVCQPSEIGCLAFKLHQGHLQ